MSIARVFGGMALAGLAGLGLFTADYVTQWSRADGSFGGPQYVLTLADRLGDKGGIVGMVFRKSSVVAAARPPAPAGWTAEVWQEVHDTYLFSPAQSARNDRELTRATLGLPPIDDMSRRDLAAFDTYLDDTSIAYRNDQGVIALSIDDPARRIAHPVWQAYLAAIDSHFDRIDTLIEYDSFQGVTWSEVHGPVELADNGSHPNRLRSFEAELGGIRLYLTTRAPDHHIARFMEAVDLGPLRRLAAEDGTPSAKAPLPAPDLARAAPLRPAPAQTALASVNRGLN